MKLINNDCIAAMKEMPDNSVDSIVTDPPYELGFMGKSWDSSGIAFNVEVWQEALRVLKPGGHLIAFSGSRTYHRMAVAIEDAGFEIRDQIMYVYGSGFPKSLNVKKAAKDKVCQCSVKWSYGTETQGTESQAEYDLRSLPSADLSQAINAENKQGQVLLSKLQEQSSSSTNRGESEKGIEDGKKSSVERRRNSQATKGQLQGSEIHSLPTGFSADGSQGWLYNGTSLSDGSMGRSDADSNRSGQSQESQSIGQPQGELGTVPNERGSQAGGSWQICGRCNKPLIDGWGTALKPAHEPMVLARKPLIKTVAANVLTYGTGGLNIDGSRVGNEGGTKAENFGEVRGEIFGGGKGKPTNEVAQINAGRWPANFIHDGSDEVVALFPSNVRGGAGATKLSSFNFDVSGENLGQKLSSQAGLADSGSAARFFYCAKASKRDRNEGLDGFETKFAPTMSDGIGNKEHNEETATKKLNHHPTVKPTDLMRYLVRLVTPPSGTVLDPFMGSGSTGKAAILEGFDFIGIEQSAEYLEIAKARIEYAQKQEKDYLL